MRRELAEICFAVELLAVGGNIDRTGLGDHMRRLDEARHAYEALPQFPQEPQVWLRAAPAIDEVQRVVARVLPPAIEAAAPETVLRAADELRRLDAPLEADLLALTRINLGEGTRAAAAADGLLRSTRSIALLFDLACGLLTGGLAALAFRSTRRLFAAEVQRAEELDAFAARVAHDIRGPLTPPLHALQRLGRELDAESPYRRLVESGVRSLLRAEAIVGDLLMFARAAGAPEAGAQASLGAVVKDVVREFEPQATAARVQVEVVDLMDSEVECAPGVLSSILGNLVGNAIKYMPSDAVERRVGIRASRTANSVRLEVSDTGAGVPKGSEKLIFDPYIRADSKVPGLGLGLATVKRLVQAHRGEVGVHSRVGGGALFWFELPARAAEPHSAAQRTQ
jgi:signal transduction histidine kinase